MKFIGTLLCTLLFAAAINAQQTMPSVEVKTLEGRTVNLQDYANNGKITVFSFWATWCAPCKRELDAIADIYPDWQEEYDVEVVAVTIDTRQQVSKVPAMVKSKNWDYIILSDTQGAAQQVLNFQAIPQTFVTDKDGNIIYSHSSYVPGDEYELEDKIKEAANK